MIGASVASAEAMPRIPDTDLEALIAGTAAGDQDDFRTLYGAISPVVYALILKMLRDRPTAQEVLQDIFVRIWTNAHRYDPVKGRAITWVLTIARRCAIDRLRREKTRPAALDLGQADIPSVENSDFAEAQDVRRCIGELDDQSRRIIALAFVYGLSHSELAKALDRPLGTVKSRVRRSLGALRRCLGGE